MVPADDKHTGNTEADTNTSTKERKRRRLTPMPDCLMHWWTPLAIAGTLFLLSMLITSIWGTATYEEIVNAIQHFPKRWPFHMRTPSREEIEVCLTITGAGLAFSAWQQRSHDNVVKEKQEQATIERDDYWKRREQTLNTPDSNNPRIRLAAVLLLAELADSTQHSKLLSDTEIRQLHQHIINTLCLQIRHEGLNLTAEGKEQEHAEIQRAILDTILTRINCDNTNHSETADWSKGHIRLTDTCFLTPIRIQNITTHATIDLSNSNLEHKLRIYNSKMGHVMWANTNFQDGVEIGQHDKPVTIQIDEIPRNISGCIFQNTTFLTRKPILIIRPTPEWKEDAPYPTTEFRKAFFSTRRAILEDNAIAIPLTSNIATIAKLPHNATARLSTQNQISP